MIENLLSSDFLKIKRKGFWLLAFLGPFGVVALQKTICCNKVTMIGAITLETYNRLPRLHLFWESRF